MMQTLIIPLYWNKEVKTGEVLNQTNGKLKGLRFSISILSIDSLAGLDETRNQKTAEILHPFLEEYSIEYIKQIIPIICEDQDLGNFLTYLLIIKTEDPPPESKLTINANMIAESALRSLNLCTSFGILHYLRYQLPTQGELFRGTIRGGMIKFDASNKGVIKIVPPTKMQPFLISSEFVSKENFSLLVNFFNNLQIMDKSSKFNYHEISELVIDLYESTFTLREYRTKFLILAVIYETIFKKENEKIQHIAKKISMFLEKDDMKRNSIYRLFHADHKNVLTIGRIRNEIAHGDLDLAQDFMKKKYSELHEIIRKILNTYFIEYSKIKHSNEYFNDLKLFLKE